MALTGKKRSLTITVNKTLAGQTITGYPKTYYGAQSFTWASINYPTITSSELANMPVSTFQIRLAAFKSYVELQETGLVINDVQTNEPYYTA